MKFMLTLALAFSAPSAFACPQFAGNWHYSGDGGSISLEIDQKDCSAMTEIYDQGWGFTVKHAHVFDRQKHLVEDNGDFQAYETAALDDTSMQIREERHSTDDDGKPSTAFINIKMTLPDAQHLSIVRETFNQDGTSDGVDTTVYERRQ